MLQQRPALREQRLDLAPQIFVVPASIGKKSGALARLALQGGVVNGLDLPPAFGGHDFKGWASDNSAVLEPGAQSKWR